MDSAIVREAALGDARGIARVHVDAWQTTYRGIMPTELLRGLSYEDRERIWVRNLTVAADGQQFVYVAETLIEPASVEAAKGEIVGFASGGPERSDDIEFTGEVYAIYLLEQFQRRGIGQRLFRASARRLSQMGKRSLLVWVAAENPSRAFYAALGGQPVRERRINIGGADIDEVGYGWSDTAPLLTSDV